MSPLLYLYFEDGAWQRGEYQHVSLSEKNKGSIQDWPIIELHHSGNRGWSQVWHRTQAEAIESSTEILCWLGESAAFSSGFSWWLLLAPFPTAWSRAFSDRRQARTYREAEGRRWSGSPCVCSHKPQFLQLFLWFCLLSQLRESIRLCSCIGYFESGVSESLH